MMIPGGYEKHFPVMLHEVLECLKPEAGKIYVDATFGNGGTARRFWMPPTAG